MPEQSDKTSAGLSVGVGADPAVGALVQLLLSHPSQSTDPDGCWDTAFSKLPFKIHTYDDQAVAQRLHWKLFIEAQKPGGGNLNSETRKARVLGYYAVKKVFLKNFVKFFEVL